MKQRTSLKYENLSQKFTNEDTSFSKQYCNIYLTRLTQMAQLLEERISKQWKGRYPVVELYKLSDEKHGKCIVIGTLFKDQKLKPSILKQLAEMNNLVPQPVVTHFTDKSDELYLEDKLQRYQIIGSFNSDEVVTGISCALLGTADDKGKFMVEDYVFVNYRHQIERPLFEDSSFVVFVSGLDLINSHNFTVNLQLLIHWIYGLVGDLNDIQTSKIARLIIAGNSIRKEALKSEPSISLLSKTQEPLESIEAVKVFDKFLADLAKVIEVDVLPGEHDPSNHILPQKPMHHCMFPSGGRYKSLNQVSNPYYCSLNGLKILGSSGQPVRDIMRFSEIQDPLDALEKCLEWSHIAPTAPDTLGCFPFYKKDPFVIEECPHVFFAGNQEKFNTRQCTGPEAQRVRLICVPEFSSSFEVCVLDLKALDCGTVSFNVAL